MADVHVIRIGEMDTGAFERQIVVRGNSLVDNFTPRSQRIFIPAYPYVPGTWLVSGLSGLEDVRNVKMRASRSSVELSRQLLQGRVRPRSRVNLDESLDHPVVTTSASRRVLRTSMCLASTAHEQRQIGGAEPLCGTGRLPSCRSHH